MRSVPSVLGLVLLAALGAGCGGKSSTSVLPPLSKVTLSVHADTVAVDGTVQFSGTAYDLSNNALPGVAFNWTTSDPAIFVVSFSGRVTAKSEGKAWLFGGAGGLKDSCSILVVPNTGGWFAQTSNSSAQLNDVFFQSDGRHGCVVGNGGEILTTADAGVTWVRRTSGTSFNLNSVWFPSAQVGWAVGGNGTVLRTADGGATWSPQPSNSSDNLMAALFSFPDSGNVVGSNGVTLKYDSIGGPPLKQNPTTFVLNGLSFSDQHDGWAVGNNGAIFGTVDRGLNWTDASGITTQSLRDVWRVSRDFAVAVGAAGTIAHTTPGALITDPPVWVLGNVGAGFNLEDVMFLDASRGWAVGSNGSGTVIATADGGTSWNPQIAPATSTLRGVYFVDRLRGWAVGDFGRILHTGTGGD